MYFQAARTALEAIPSVQQINKKELNYVLQVCEYFIFTVLVKSEEHSMEADSILCMTQSWLEDITP